MACQFVQVIAVLLTLLPGAFTKVANVSTSELPVIDLGYELHRARLYNESGAYYDFSNIRFAAAPVGELRFRAPHPPLVNRSVIQTGEQFNICPQAYPVWTDIVSQYIPKYLAGQTTFVPGDFEPTDSPQAIPTQLPGSSEDCLFLDVLVPKAVFDKRGSGRGAPVVVWIFGGGYVSGTKNDRGNPAGLIKTSQEGGGDGVVLLTNFSYVALNYRLGAFGFLGGPTLQQDGTANAGLLDQRFALDWIQDHIGAFGGDPNRVTLLGQSAGGGSILQQITAWGGSRRAPFNQVVISSPAQSLEVSVVAQEETLSNFLGLLNVTTIHDARQLPYDAIQRANTLLIQAAAYGDYVFGPTIDGDFATALPGPAILSGKYAKGIRAIVAHNYHDGFNYTSPYISNDTAFRAAILQRIPGLTAWPEQVNYISQTLYPAIFDGSQAYGYTDQIGRFAALITDAEFGCGDYYLEQAYRNRTHAYVFSVDPAFHAQDVPYIFFNGPSLAVKNDEIALNMQRYITTFALTGTPNSKRAPFFPRYSGNRTVVDLNITSTRDAAISYISDPLKPQRCSYWQKALFY